MSGVPSHCGKENPYGLSPPVGGPLGLWLQSGFQLTVEPVQNTALRSPRPSLQNLEVLKAIQAHGFPAMLNSSEAARPDMGTGRPALGVQGPGASSRLRAAMQEGIHTGHCRKGRPPTQNFAPPILPPVLTPHPLKSGSPPLNSCPGFQSSPQPFPSAQPSTLQEPLSSLQHTPSWSPPSSTIPENTHPGDHGCSHPGRAPWDFADVSSSKQWQLLGKLQN